MLGSNFEPTDRHLFLAMCRGGGGPFTLPDMIGAYDCVNRFVLTVKEFNGAINRLLAAKLIELRGTAFKVRKQVLQDFQNYRQRTRRDRFDTVDAYFARIPPPKKVVRRVSIRSSAFESACRQYFARFAKEARR